jgi:hypothetical protein
MPEQRADEDAEEDHVQTFIHSMTDSARTETHSSKLERSNAM